MTDDAGQDLMFTEMRELLMQAERIQRAFLQSSLVLETAGLGASAAQLPLNIIETATAILVTAAVPGATLDDIDARIDGQQLVLVWRRVLHTPKEPCAVHLLEIPGGQIARQLPLPFDVSLSAMALKDGLLRITLTPTRGGR
jgi:HSP20 family molecular chaperone IbpA